MSFSTLSDATERALQQNNSAYGTLVLAALQIVDYFPRKTTTHTYTHQEDGVNLNFLFHFLTVYYSIHISHNPHMTPTHNPLGGSCQSLSSSLRLN